MLGGLIRGLARSLRRSIAWSVATRVPIVERVVQPVPGKAGWVRIAVSGFVFQMPEHRWWNTFVRDWEADTFRAYRALIRPGDSVVDVGAWIGPTVMFACACGAGRILAIEPNPTCRPYLDALAAAIPSTGAELVVCSVGVGAIAGEVEFGLTDGREIAPRASASLFGRGVRIQVARLPDLLARHGIINPDFVKIDTEGAEFLIADQIGALSTQPGIRIFLSLHPPMVPASVDTSDLINALAHFDLYDARLKPIAHDTVTARIHSSEPMPSWGTIFGNYFEIMLVPAGEPLKKGPRQRPVVAARRESRVNGVT